MWFAYTLHVVDTSKADWTTINEIIPTDKLWIYPNPCSDLLTVSLQSPLLGDGILSVTNIMGQCVIQKSLKYRWEAETINTANFEDGVYFLCVKDHKSSFLKKFVVHH